MKRYQNILFQVKNSLVELDDGLENDNSLLNQKVLGNCQSHPLHQIQESLKSMIQEIPKYTDLIFGIRDGVVQLDNQLIKANDKASCKKENRKISSPSTVNNNGCQKNYITEIFLSLKAIVKGMKSYQDILFGIRDGIVVLDNSYHEASPSSKQGRRKYGGNRVSSMSSSSDISKDSSDGESFSTWDLDEWLVVDTL